VKTAPTIGRVVHVHNRPGNLDKTLPEAAQVAFVHSPTCINVGGVDHNGQPFSATSVEFREEGNPRPDPIYTWAQFPPRF
jgi:hypothetical protein